MHPRDHHGRASRARRQNDRARGPYIRRAPEPFSAGLLLQGCLLISMLMLAGCSLREIGSDKELQLFKGVYIYDLHAPGFVNEYDMRWMRGSIATFSVVHLLDFSLRPALEEIIHTPGWTWNYDGIYLEIIGRLEDHEPRAEGMASYKIVVFEIRRARFLTREDLVKMQKREID